MDGAEVEPRRAAGHGAAHGGGGLGGLPLLLAGSFGSSLPPPAPTVPAELCRGAGPGDGSIGGGASADAEAM